MVSKLALPITKGELRALDAALARPVGVGSEFCSKIDEESSFQQLAFSRRNAIRYDWFSRRFGRWHLAR
jgi:hypothetical protein